VRLAVLLLWVIVLILGACSSSSEDVIEESTPSASAAATGADGDETAATTGHTVDTTSTTEGATTTAATGDTVDTTSTTEGATTTAAARVSEQWIAEEGPAVLLLVEDFYAALNSGDSAAALDMIKGNEILLESLGVAVDGTNAVFSADCSISEDRPIVNCTEKVTDDLYGPAGITLRGGTSFARLHYGTGTLLNIEQSVASACISESYSGTNYLVDLYEWITVAHPELAPKFTGDLSQGTLGIPCTAYPFRDGDNASEVCNVVPDFVAQSNQYPILDL
jgi:hypothetical protein